MISRRFKNWLFINEALGSLACGFYGEYFYFMLRERYGFTNLGNLSISAFQGLIFAVAAWQGGKFAESRGYLAGFRTGLIMMMVALVLGGVFRALPLQLGVFFTWTAGMCFVSPSQEALITHREPLHLLPKTVGTFNVVWAACSASAYFLGGAVFEHLGRDSIYWLPAGVFGCQLLLLGILEKRSACASDRPDILPAAMLETMAPSRKAPGFIRLAWLANPFACVGINSMLALIPSLAHAHHLSTSAAGVFCSVWFFARLASFAGLQRWAGWHYRFRWLLAALAGLIGGFTTFLVASSLWHLLLAQIVFGLSVGFIYYSSLFYSMDANDRKAEHGGVHEAMMGIGNCVGPSVGAAGLLLAPQIPNVCAYAVGLILTGGLLGVVCLRLSSAFRPLASKSNGSIPEIIAENQTRT